MRLKTRVQRQKYPRLLLRLAPIAAALEKTNKIVPELLPQIEFGEGNGQCAAPGF